MEKQKIDHLVGTNIKREREQAGYTQDRFSELVGIGPKSLSAVERGVVGVSLQTLLRMCRILHITPNALLSAHSRENQVQDLTEQLECLTPAQFAIARNVLTELMKAFNVESA